MAPDRDDRQRWSRVGWFAYLGSAVGYLVMALIDGNVIGIIASLLFLIGTLAFLIPLLRDGPE